MTLNHVVCLECKREPASAPAKMIPSTFANVLTFLIIPNRILIDSVCMRGCRDRGERVQVKRVHDLSHEDLNLILEFLTPNRY